MSDIKPATAMNAFHQPLDWLIEGTLRSDVAGIVAHDLDGPLRLGDWVVEQDEPGTPWKARRELKDVAPLNLYLKTYPEIRAIESAVTLATCHSYYLDPVNALSVNHTGPEPAYVNVNHTATTIAPPSKLSKIAVADIKILYSVLSEMEVSDAAARLILQDLRLAIEENSKYSLLHMYRALDTIRGDFGGWKEMCKQLNISKGYIDYVKKLRSERIYRVAHGDAVVKSSEMKDIGQDALDEAMSRTLKIVRGYFEHVGVTSV